MPTIVSLYRQLFGKRDPVEGSVIDMAEHGRAGGVSTGQGAKVTRNLEEKTLIDSTDANNIYIGKSRQGGDTTAAVWQVKVVSTSGTVVSILYADSNDNYDNVWSNRAGLTYG